MKLPFNLIKNIIKVDKMKFSGNNEDKWYEKEAQEYYQNLSQE